jgi:Flp pilus assembly protein TadD
VSARRAPRALLAAGIALLTAVAFLPALRNGFILYDDTAYITGNPHVAGGLTGAGLRWALTATEASNWHPLTWAAHMLDVTLFGLDPAGHHLTSVALHAATGALLFLLLAALTGDTLPSALIAALFAVHPLRVESVAWASEKKDLLAGLFWVLTTAAYVRHARRPGPGRLVPVLCLFALGLAAKPMLVSLPLVLLLLDWWPLGRLPPRLAAGPAAPGRSSPSRLLAEKLPLLALAAAAAAVTWQAQRGAGAVKELGLIPFWPRALNAALSTVRYLQLTLWPSGLSPLYPHPGPNLSLAAALASAAFVVAATLVALRRRALQPWLLAGWLWYLAALAPVVGIVQVGWQGMADRYTYLPLVGPVLALVWEAGVRTRGAALRRARGVAAALVVAALATLTWRQAAVWHDSVSVFSAAAAATRDNLLAELLLGRALRLAGRPAEATAHLREALRINPRHPEVLDELGVTALALGDPGGAVRLLRQALALDPDAARYRSDLGVALERSGDPTGALQEYLAAERLDPALAPAQLNAGMLLLQLGRGSEAAAHLRRARGLPGGGP